ncbi:BolA family protein [Patulibacter sp. SYSU D01012]|uniref:BolA/IbaG family iron-sulfur metabolism protein n=1 Tax=Patulibacter sp. SYSU D01012 TaxID=2817381 RepID=UPI001B312BC2|nr:BolA family protein [Patulibacter sp. SYSU D01012]
MPTADEIKQRIEGAIPEASAQVEGADGVHFQAVVTSPAFAGKTRVAQHRMVMDVFAGELGGSIHALALTTKTPS